MRKLIHTPLDPSLSCDTQNNEGYVTKPVLPGDNQALFAMFPKSKNWVVPTRDYRFAGYQLTRIKSRCPDYNLVLLPPKNQKEMYRREVRRQATFNYRNRTVYLAQPDGTLRRPTTFVRDASIDPLILGCDPETRLNRPGQSRENRYICDDSQVRRRRSC